MSQATWLITPALTLVLMVAVIYLARMLRGWHIGGEQQAVRVHRDRVALEDEKHRLLVTVQDLQVEYELGKLTEEDYTAMKQRFEREAVAIIEKLGAL